MNRTQKKIFKKNMIHMIRQAIINRGYFNEYFDLRWLENYMYKRTYLKPYRTRGYLKEIDEKFLKEYHY